jgi:hypothetical protein
MKQLHVHFCDAEVIMAEIVPGLHSVVAVYLSQVRLIITGRLLRKESSSKAQMT